jgi:hypothetical protein
MHIVEASAIPPDAPTRRLFAEAAKREPLRHYSVVHTAHGFKAASIRAVVSASIAMSRPSAAHSVHADIESAAHWHAEHQRRIGRRETAEQIARIAESLRTLHRERFPKEEAASSRGFGAASRRG